MREAFPIDQSLQLIPFSRDPAPDRWARVARAMMLRKFALGRSDQVHVERVLDAIETCATDPAQFAGVGVAAVRDEFKTLAREIAIHEGEGPEDVRTAPEVIVELIYGGLLHGDWSKHETMKGRAPMTVDLSLALFINAVEHYIYELRGWVRRGIEDGTLANRTFGLSHPATNLP